MLTPVFSDLPIVNHRSFKRLVALAFCSYPFIPLGDARKAKIAFRRKYLLCMYK